LACTIRSKGVRISQSIYVEPGKFEVLLQSDPKEANLIVGGLQNVIQKSYNHDIQHLRNTMQKLGQLYEHGTEEERIQIGDQLNLLNKQEQEIRDRYIQIYPTSLAMLDATSAMVDVMTFEQLRSLKGKLSEELAYAPSYKHLLQKYEEKKSEQLVGKPAPDIVSTTDQGSSFRLSSLAGKLVLLDFWASWCTPCRAANQKLKPIYAKYKDRGFEIVSFSFDDKENLWKNAIKKDGIPWIQVSDLQDLRENTTAETYHVRSLPTIYLIDEQGKVVAQNINKDELIKLLTERFGD
jgi:thiol-disulfide isomerase/thioredoxin